MARGKYIMRVNTGNGTYRYLYTPEEVAAYKQGRKEPQQMQKKKTYQVQGGIASSPHYEYKKTKDQTRSHAGSINSEKTEQYGKGDGSSKTVTTTKVSMTKSDRKALATPEDKLAYKGAKNMLNSKKTIVDDFAGKTTYSKGSVKKDKNGTDKWNYKETEVTGSYRTDKNEKSKHKNTISSDEALAQAYANLKKKKKK